MTATAVAAVWLVAAVLGPRLGLSVSTWWGASRPERASLSARDVSCKVSLPTTWSEAITTNETEVVPLGTGPIPFAVSADGLSYFADDYSTDWSGIVEVKRVGGATREVYEFPSPSYQVYQGAYDGRWLVWTLSATSVNPVPATLMAWDSVTGRLTTLVRDAGSSSDISFALASSGAQARDGLLAWTIIPDLVRGGGFSVWSLSRGAGASIHTGGSPGGGEFIDDHYLFVYFERSLHYGALTTPSWQRAPEPAALKVHLERAYGDSGSAAVSVTSRDVVWVDPGGVVSQWQSSARAPQEIAAGMRSVENLTQAGTAILWTQSQSGDVYVFDRRSNSYARLPIRLGSYFANGNEVTLSWSPHPLLQKADPVITSSFLDIASLPRLPGCK
ncbi:MAG: hypothetical protein WA938_04880 [Candidatus Dormiibacterota bacterium]